MQAFSVPLHTMWMCPYNTVPRTVKRCAVLFAVIIHLLQGVCHRLTSVPVRSSSDFMRLGDRPHLSLSASDSTFSEPLVPFEHYRKATLFLVVADSSIILIVCVCVSSSPMQNFNPDRVPTSPVDVILSDDVSQWLTCLFYYVTMNIRLFGNFTQRTSVCLYNIKCLLAKFGGR